MTEATLVAGLGASSFAAVLAVGDDVLPVREPVSGRYTWPAAVFGDGGPLLVGSLAEARKLAVPAAYSGDWEAHFRDGTPLDLAGTLVSTQDVMTAFLTRLGDAARAAYATDATRLMVVVPAAYAGVGLLDAVISAGEAAGFPVVETIPEPVAAAGRPDEPKLPPGALALVYDLGAAAFDAALIRLPGPAAGGGVSAEPELIASRRIEAGGRDLDALIAAHLRAHADPVLAAALTPGPRDSEAAARLELRLADFTRRLREALSDEDDTVDYFDDLNPDLPATRLDRATLADLTAPLIDQTLTCCADLLEATGTSPADITAIIFTGGATRSPLITGPVTAALGRPARQGPDPERAALSGAAKLAPGATRSLTPVPLADGELLLRWDPPGNSGILTRWHLKPGEPFTPGQPVAQVRAADTTLWDLIAPRTTGTLTQHHVPAGALITHGHWTAAGQDTAPVVMKTPKVLRSVKTGRVRGVTFSPGGTLLATASDDHTARIWNIADGTSRTTLKGHRAAVSSVAFSPDGTLLATASDDHTALIWDVADGTSRTTLKGHRAAVNSVAFSPDGLLAATGGDDHNAHIWDVRTGQKLAGAYHRADNEIDAVAWSPDGFYLVTGGPYLEASRIWQVAQAPGAEGDHD